MQARPAAKQRRRCSDIKSLLGKLEASMIVRSKSPCKYINGSGSAESAIESKKVGVRGRRKCCWDFE